MTAPKPRRISREEAIRALEWMLADPLCVLHDNEDAAVRYCIRVLKREQKAADAQKKDKRRTKR